MPMMCEGWEWMCVHLTTSKINFGSKEFFKAIMTTDTKKV